MKKILFLLLIPCLLMAGCSMNKEIKIGIVAPITGDSATFGESTKNGATLYFDAINVAGGINGMKIKYFVEDDKGDPVEGANVYSKLVDQDRVSVIVGTVQSRVSLAGAPICQAKGIPMISPTSTNTAVTQQGNFIFRACFIDPFQGKVAAKFAFENLQKKTAAVLYDAGNDYPKGLAEAFKENFTGLGGQVLAFESYSTGTTDFNAQLVKIKNVNPDIIFLPQYYNDVGLMAKQARQMGIQSVLLGGDGWDSPELFKIGGEAIEGSYFVNHFTPESTAPKAVEFVKQYKEKFNKDPDALAALAYEAAMVVVDAIQRANTTDPKAIRDAIEKTNLETITGTITFDENRNPIKGAVVLEIKGGKMTFNTAINP